LFSIFFSSAPLKWEIYSSIHRGSIVNPITLREFEMPNWCYTDFTVSGPTEEVTRFREAVRGSDDSGETPFDFDRVIPMPSELLETINDAGTAYDVYYGNAEPMLSYP
jgi:hypothetical protein